MTAPARLRPMRDSDKGHVVSSWLKSFSDSEAAREVRRAQSNTSLLGAYAAVYDDRPKKSGPASLYYTAHEALIHRLLARSDVRVLSDTLDDDVIIGWRAVQGEFLHYACIKPDFQRMGLGKVLLEDLMDRHMTVTHWSDVCDRIGMPRGWEYSAGALKECLT